MAKYHLSRVAPTSAAVTYAVIAATMTVLLNIFNFAYGTYVYFTSPKKEVSFGALVLSSFIDLLATMVAALLVGIVLGLSVSWVYNWWAKKLGGIKIDLDEER